MRRLSFLIFDLIASIANDRLIITNDFHLSFIRSKVLQFIGTCVGSIRTTIKKKTIESSIIITWLFRQTAHNYWSTYMNTVALKSLIRINVSLIDTRSKRVLHLKTIIFSFLTQSGQRCKLNVVLRFVVTFSTRSSLRCWNSWSFYFQIN